MTTLDPTLDRTRFLTLATDVASGAGELVRAHGEQLRQEVRANTATATRSAVFLATGVFVAIFAMGALTVTSAFALMQFAGWSPALAWGVVSAALVAIAAVLLIAGLSMLQSVRVVPTHTLHSVWESLQWFKQR